MLHIQFVDVPFNGNQKCQVKSYITCSKSIILDKKRLNKITNWLYDYGWDLLNATSVLSIGLLKIFWRTPNFWMYVVLLGLILLYSYTFYEGIKKKKKLSAKEEEIANLQIVDRQKIEDINELKEVITKYQEGYSNFLKSFLRIVAVRLNLSPAERITVYEHKSNYFQSIGRYSENQALMESGRPTYPDSEGYIAIGFHQNEFFSNGYPDPEANFNQYYEKVSQECDIPKSTCKKLSMKSRSYCSFSISNPITHDKNAVIVIESLRPGFNILEEYKTMHEEVSTQINAYLHHTNDTRPDPSFAKRLSL